MAAIKQGDQYAIPVEIDFNDLGEDAVTRIEFAFAPVHIRKYYPDQVTKSGGKYLIPLTQAETLSFRTKTATLDIRVKFQNGDVRGIDHPIEFDVADSISKEVL